ncbi:multiple epidermal growth factor-like domains protein 8 isoform X2 [Anopheles coustani]|uniref:multiple epidermal growth factor-like domains protein 8 isoform X2 n=2 Tax=coustani group TaxID=59130 RepID=UPI002659B835|nr:multiple epidermal growth factor-like domains protein 8 isoform X2 [Anopheles coustani]
MNQLAPLQSQKCNQRMNGSRWRQQPFANTPQTNQCGEQQRSNVIVRCTSAQQKKAPSAKMCRRVEITVRTLLSAIVVLHLLPYALVGYTLAKTAQPKQSCDKTRRVFTQSHGEISDGPSGSNYTQDSHCEWLIRAANDSQFITLKFRSMGTECSYDYIFIYDGDSFRSPLLGSFSGNTEPQHVVASSGSMLILLYSDTNYVLEGFRAEFFVTNCPNNCTGNGRCADHMCVCDSGWMGSDCSLEVCPFRCGEEEGRGKCRTDRCECSMDYVGQSCSLHRSNPVPKEWHWLSKSRNGLPPRAAHTAVYHQPSDSLYVFGGYNLNEVLDSLYVYRFAKNQWEDEWGLRVEHNHTEASGSEAEEKALRRAMFLEVETDRLGLSKEPNFLSNVIYTLADNRTDVDGYGNGSRPAARYGHAAATVPDGFVLFGGKLSTGQQANDLWLYNVSHQGGAWFERGLESRLRPPPLTRHTLTLAGGFLYVFGGATEDGEFSPKLFRIALSARGGEEQWEEVIPRGGKALDVRMVAHTTSYQRATNSLIVYGGLVANVARFSRLSERMFAFQLDHKHWAELQYPRTALHDGYAPRERAFHSTNIIGNYLLVFGGYSHKHNKEEICYDNQMYLYHLGCHSWINPEVLGAVGRFRYPKKQGVFAHAAAVRAGNTLLVVGGYHGNVNGDLLAYSLPVMLVVHGGSDTPEAACPRHTSFNECLADLECGWCSADSVCYGRTIGANCTTNLQTTRCKGICSVLGDCHSCLVHGTSSVDLDPKAPSFSIHHHQQSIAHKLGLDRCTWCVQNARCHHKDDNYGVCGEDTPSQKPGWWGSKGTEVTSPRECTALDKRPGLTFLKYLHPMNVSMPDAVMIVNATMADFTSPPSNTPTEQLLGGPGVVARLLGFIRFPPVSPDQSMAWLQACVSHANAVLRTVQVPPRRSSANSHHHPTLPPGGPGLSMNFSANESVCDMLKWPDRANILVDFRAQRNKVGFAHHPHHTHHHGHHGPDLSKMSLQHVYGGALQAFTFEFLEPYSNGTACETYGNCLECLSDSSCGWCELADRCLSRQVSERDACRDGAGNWRYLTIQPAHCSNCSNYISCEQCLGPGAGGESCEWWTEDATCARRGRSEEAVRTLDQCPMPCYQRADCSSCLNDRGRCVWCEATSQCFSFSVYTSEYQFGMCREWLDQTLPLGGGSLAPAIEPPPVVVQQCKSCASHQNCSYCLRSLSCGWCYDEDNPINGVCMQGDFGRSSKECTLSLNGTDRAETRTGSWAYAQCPDVDECELGLHDCHEQAECSNTHGSYNCKCRKGYFGDGVRYCRQTCYESCVHGHCSGAPDFRCVCDLGWTGVDCSVNCACNNHSTCLQGVGKCDRCLNWTEGEFCERCSPGSYGNATTEAGCQRCDCNGHGNVALGICDGRTGECYCQDYTEGLHCENCNRNFYGEPKDGGQCYHECASRGVLTQVGTQGLGSFQSHRSSWSGQETRECLWIVSPQVTRGSPELRNAIIQIEIEADRMNVTCGENAVYVYDGLPDLTGVAQQKQLIAVFCNENRGSWITEARSGHLTVHFKKGPSSEQGFNAIYSVMSCATGSCHRPYICTEDGQRCVCPKGFTGPRCAMRICPSDCNEESRRGVCDTAYGRCICAAGYGGDDCSQEVRPSSVVYTELFNSYLVSESFEHLRKTLPRFGHSLVADRRGSLWMFGGYSLSHGPLNDIRQFDTRNNTWMQVTVDSSPEDRMPQGRYYHAADIVIPRQSIYIYGGLARNGTLDDLWQFGLQTQRWSVVWWAQENTTAQRPPALAGHTLNYVRDGEREVLLLIGGYSIGQSGLQSLVWMFNLATNVWTAVVPSGEGTAGPGGIYGHTAVYHAASQLVYVYGGIRTVDGVSVVSNRLYTFSVASRTWAELPPFIYHGGEYVPAARYLHSAVATENYMLVFGGRSTNFSSLTAAQEVMVAYVYRCNQWIRLAKDADKVGTIYGYTYAQAMAQDPDGGAMYVVAGWDGSNHCRVTRIQLPDDLCDLWSGSKYFCRQYTGCSFCSVKTGGAAPSSDGPSHCYSTGASYHACETYNGTISFNSGTTCDAEWIGRRACGSFKTCSSCLATYPWHGEQESPCKWCPDCAPKGSCVQRSVECAFVKVCYTNQTATLELEQCPGVRCVAGDCVGCRAMPGCSWERDETTQRYGCQIPVTPKATPAPRNVSLETCPVPCSTYRNCTACVKHPPGARTGSSSECLWSTQLNECISPTFQPLYCSGGICGLVVQLNDAGHCPEPCASFTQCASCLRHAYCGWCARNDTDGEGVCTEGSADGPANHPAGSTCAAIYQTRSKAPTHEAEGFGWHYFKCPPENECTNGHHSCNARSQRCVDHLHGYECVCAPGYNATVVGGGGGTGGGGVGGQCVPVCSQGCVRGSCREPDVCDCEFGYVGANCSIQCQCNGHSDCAGPDRLDRCLQCHNNTKGPQCDKCLPFYVGDPRNSGGCVPCIEHCNGQTDVCIGRDQESALANLSRGQIEDLIEEGPLADAICLGCGNYTDGDRCETCVPGYFRRFVPGKPCWPCECNGHGDMCDPNTGEKCNCGNNTESDNTCSSKGKNHAYNCWSLQCTKCKDSYSGHPYNGHQCYKHITVESRMCFDAKTIDECKIKPQPLKAGQTVFFVIQPRYMNVDIRFIVDVTQGELDFYMSPTDESFIVQTNGSTGHHDIHLDGGYAWYRDSPGSASSSARVMNSDPADEVHPLNIRLSDTPATGERNSPACGGQIRYEGYLVTDRTAKDLITYVTLRQCKFLLRVFALKNRLVVTLPHTVHALGQTKFYIALRARSGSAASYGLVFFRQDQLHIHLFVFFSVFFSCFFLFLAICVLAWKAKQAADMRRARRRHVVEMLHMAKRPFGRVNLSLECPTVSRDGADGSGTTPAPHRRRGRGSKHSSTNAGGSVSGVASSNPAMTQHSLAHQHQQQPADVAPIALEPTADNYAAVGTVFVRLPGKQRSQMTLALASALIVMGRSGSYPSYAIRGHHHHHHRRRSSPGQAAGGNACAPLHASSPARHHYPHHHHHPNNHQHQQQQQQQQQQHRVEVADVVGPLAERQPFIEVHLEQVPMQPLGAQNRGH